MGFEEECISIRQQMDLLSADVQPKKRVNTPLVAVQRSEVSVLNTT